MKQLLVEYSQENSFRKVSIHLFGFSFESYDYREDIERGMHRYFSNLKNEFFNYTVWISFESYGYREDIEREMHQRKKYFEQ